MNTSLARSILFTSLILLSPGAATSAPQQASAMLSPATSDGPLGSINFQYGFRNCYGKVSLAFGKETIHAKSYQYEGKVYSPPDLGLSEFKKISAKGSNISADVYAGTQKLGSAEFKNVIFFADIGCFSETYAVIDLLGLNNSDYKNRIEELRLDNIRITSAARSYKTEELIIQKLAEQKITEKKRADQATAATAPVRTAAVPEAPKASSVSKSTPPPPLPTTAPTQVNKTNTVNYEELAQANQEQKLKDEAATQKAAEGLSGAASGFSKGISGSGDGFGFSLMLDNANNSDSPFSPLFLGMVFGKVQDPTLAENTQGLLSGVSFQTAFNMEWLEEPSTYTTDKYNQNNRRWDLLLEAKLYGNITPLQNFQPYIGLGYASYTDFNRRNVKVGDGWTFVKSVGLSVLGSSGAFSIGINPDMKVLDLSFFTHM